MGGVYGEVFQKWTTGEVEGFDSGSNVLGGGTRVFFHWNQFSRLFLMGQACLSAGLAYHCNRANGGWWQNDFCKNIYTLPFAFSFRWTVGFCLGIHAQVGCKPNMLKVAGNKIRSSYVGSLTRRLRDADEATEVAHLKELYHQNNPEAVIRAFESQHSLHCNPSALPQYVKALVKVDRLDQTKLLKTLQRASEWRVSFISAVLELQLLSLNNRSEHKSAIISEENRRITGFHEGGHALVAMHTAGALPVHKATVVPRGSALGMVTQLPDKDQTSISCKQMLAYLDVSMGSRVDEELIFGESEVTSGLSSDISHATNLARKMVTRYGMSNKVGLVTHDYNDNGKSMSSETRLLIENEEKRLLERAYINAKTILSTHDKELRAIANAFPEHETLAGNQIKALLEKVRSKQQQHQKTIESQSSSLSNPIASSTAAAAASKAQGATPVGS
ncbi:ATP-dependent zinc metalloprotease FTSH 4, mitochondrial [Glycine max]|nr:ATP-dependent zinc metalloprotease FTSH 4, mitochondrial [Glycine max]